MVKRVGNLMQPICELGNVQEAFLRAAKGKAGKREVREFRSDIDRNLDILRTQLRDGTFRFGHYHFFTIYDPKRRVICAASFPERVAFHAIMRICHPVFDEFQISDSYASRIGKGTYAALDRARLFAAKYRWFVKMDVCKYFDSIHHSVLFGQLCRLFKDPVLLTYFRELIDGYEVEEGRGLPIGNLTSQYFANHYLAVADHYAKERLGVKAIIRYMDDILLFGNDLDDLRRTSARLAEFIHNELLLELHTPVINRTRLGIPFLGYVVYARGLRLNQRSRHRFRHKMKAYTDEVNQGSMSQEEYAMRVQCLLAFVNKAEADGFLHSVAKEMDY